MTQTVLVTGAGGQLGRELVLTANAETRCIGLTRSQLDICDSEAVGAILKREKPILVINAAAYTAVDKAESDRDNAARINETAPGILAKACGMSGARLIHVSTDFVFDGESNRPYKPESVPNPIGEYGRTKLDGERAVREYLPEALIIRTGWVYSCFGSNFVKTMLRLMAERDELSVVADQVGTPTWARGLALAIWAASEQTQLSGIYHWSDAGVCSWYDFALAIYEEASGLGLLSTQTNIVPISAAEYPTPAERPHYSVLDKTRSWQDFQLQGVHWRIQLRSMLKQLKETENE
ncbi:MAG: dTDP-4-dehydrorhamnose reductase [Halioglobus sp.]